MTQQPWVAARDAEGVRHCHGEHCDDYWYRPLVYGKDLFTYIAHVPPGGGVPADEEEAKLFELSLYILSGDLQVTLGAEVFTMAPHTALHIPKGVPVGFHNATGTPATLLLSFAPPPSTSGPDEMRKRVEERGRRMWSAAEMNQLAGDFFK